MRHVYSIPAIALKNPACRVALYMVFMAMSVAPAAARNPGEALHKPAPAVKAFGERLASAALLFTENRGQVADSKGTPRPDILFTAHSGGAQVFLTAGGIHYQFRKTTFPEGYEQDEEEVKDDAHQEALRRQIKTETYRFSLSLEGANAHPKVRREAQDAYTENFFLAQCPNGITGVHTYGRVVMEDVYPGIDWVIYSFSPSSGGGRGEARMKYDFVVKAGADPSLIKLRVKDAESVSIDKEGALVMKTSLGEVKEAAPVSFAGGEKIATSFRQNADGTIGFAVAKQEGRTLNIDPSVAWATYYGGNDTENGEDCTTDGSGNVYLAGITQSTSAIASGGHQNTFGGNTEDAFLVKFNSSGVRQWATYYGGSGDDEGNSCGTDGSGNVYLAGTTESTSAIASGGHQNTYGGGSFDGFLVKFNSSGVRQWATYYGGGNTDYAHSVAIDGSGNVHLSGHSLSTSAIASGGHQNTYGGGTDAYLVKFNSSGVRQWATYYGGGNSDDGYFCATDVSGNVYMAGKTVSTSAIASGGHQNTYGGSTNDAFLVKFNSSGVRQWATYYGGTGDDIAYSCATDASGNAYLAGYAESTSAIASGGHQNSFGGNTYDAFLVKFNSSGVRQWGTYYGGSGDDHGRSCATDANGNVYLAGYTGSASAIASGGYQNTNSGGTNDAFLVKFNSSGVRQWGTYYGGSGNDRAHACAIDGVLGNIYLAGYTASTSAIATGGHQNTFGGGTYDAFVTLVNDIVTGAVSPGRLCAGATVSVPFTLMGTVNTGNTFTAQLSDATGSFALPVAIGTLTGTVAGTISATIPAGTPSGAGYRIRVVSSSPVITGTDNGSNIIIGGNRMYVDGSVATGGTGASWASPFKTLDTALYIANATTCTQEIWVKQGTYYPMAGGSVTTSRDSSFRILRNDIKVYGGFNGTETTLAQRSVTTNVTILSGDIGVAADSTDNVYHVVTFVPTAATPIDTTATTLDGFTITLGNALAASGNFTVNGQSIARQFAGGIYMGAALSGLVCSPKIANCTITRNAATNGGGSCLNAGSGGNASPVFRNSGFSGNNSGNQGGGIYITSASAGGQTNPVFDNCTFTSNIVTANGAGMAAGVTSPAIGLVTIKSCTFTTNKQTAASASSGSALFFNLNVSAVISKCSFNSNTAANFGGGIEALDMQNLTIDSSSFTGNTCGSTGGAIDLTGAAVTITNSTFTGNKSGSGGGIEFETSGSLSVTNSTFINDTATVSGGAMRNAVSSGVTVTNSRFLNNYAVTGSAALDNAGNSLANMTGCIFSGNKAGTLGGVLNNANGTAVFTNCVLESNSTTATTANGGAVHVAAGTVTFNNSTLNNNTTASTSQPNSNSIGIDAGATAVLNNTIVWGSAANHIAGSGTLTRNYSDVKGIAATANNLNIDPQFTNAADPDGADNTWSTADDGLSLIQCSPVINVGSNALIPAGVTTDITGAARIQQTTVDMGAYEFGSSNVLAITAAATNPTTCGGTNGSISLSGLTAATAYTVNYSMNGVAQSPLTLTANGSGVIIISGLSAGNYTNLSVTRGACVSNIITGPVTLSPPAAPVITSVTPVNPLTCGGTTGTMTLNGLAASTIYTITYFDGVSTVTLINQTSTAAGTITITGLGAGSYSSITAILAGCSGIYGSTVILSSPLAPAAPTASNNGPICVGSTLNLGASTVAGGTYVWSGPGSYSSATQNPSITNAQVVNSGSYSVTVTVAGCTSAPGNTTVTVNPIPVITTVAGTNPLTCGGNTGTITLNGLAASTIYTVTYFNGTSTVTLNNQTSTATGTITITGLPAGTYSAITAILAGCSGVYGNTVTLSSPLAPAAPTASNNGPICAGSTLNLGASTVAGGTYAWSGPGSYSSATQNPAITNAQVANSGTYSVTVTVAGCVSAPGTTTVTVNPTPAITASSTNPTTCGGTNGAISLSGLTTSITYTANYSFNGNPQSPLTLTANGSGVITISGLGAGSYTNISVTSLSCTSNVITGPVILSPPAAPVITSVTPTNPLTCGGTTGTMTLNGLAASTIYTVTYFNGTSTVTLNNQTSTATGTITITGLPAGTYSAITAILSGCSGVYGSTVTLSSPLAPAAPTASNNGPICAGSALNLGASTVAGGTYAWSGPGSYSSAAQNPSITNAQVVNSGTYSVTVTVAGCTSAPGNTTVTVNPIPAITTVASTNPLTCGGITGTMTLSGLAASTIYTITYFNGASTVTLNNQTSTTAGTITITGLGAGSYSNITAILAGCSGVYGNTVTLSSPVAPAAPTASNNGPICAGSTLNLGAPTVAGGTYTWSGPGSYTSATQNPSITNAQIVNSGTYSVTVTIAGCVSAPGTTTVTVNPTPAITAVAGTSPTTCSGTNGSITLSGLTASTAYVINFSRNATAQAPQTLTANSSGVVTISSLNAGTYTLFTATLGSCTAPATGSVTLSDPAPPAAPTISSNSPVCAGSTLLLTGPATAGVTYSWSGPNGFTSILQSPSITGATTAATGTYTLTLTNTTTLCTSSPATLTVTVYPIPIIATSSSTNPLTCSGATGTITLNGLTANSSYTVNYLKNSVAQTATITANATGSVIITGLTAGTYTFINVTQNGCSSGSVASIVLNDPAVPAAPVAGSNSPVCQGAALNLTATGLAGATFSWTGPVSFTSAVANPSIPNMQAINAGTYSVTQTLAGCVSTAATTVVAMSTVPAAPGAITGNAAPCAASSYTYSISPVATATSYTWSVPSGWTITSSPANTTSITVTTGTAGGTISVTASNGCGPGSASTLAAGILAIPATPGTITGPAALCNGTNANYSIALVSGATGYTWSVPAGWTSSPSLNTLAVTAGPNSGNISVTAGNVCGTSSPNTLAVTVTSIPGQPGTITGNTSPCIATSQTYSVSPVAGATSYVWTTPAGWAGSSSTTSATYTVGGSSGNVSVAASNSCGAGAPRTLAVAVTQLPAQPGPISGPSAPCVGSTVTYSVVASTGATSYSWQVPTGWNGSSTTNTVNVLAGTAAGSVIVTPVGLCGNGAPQTLAVTPTPVLTPSVSVAATGTTICQNSTDTFRATAVNGGTSPAYQWKKNGVNVGSNSPTYIDNALSNGDVITVTMSSSLPCVSSSFVTSSPITLMVNPLVVPGVNINTVPPIILCQGTSVLFTTNITGGGAAPTYQWYKNGIAIAGAIFPTYTDPGTLVQGDTVRVIMTTSAACPSTPTALSNKAGVTVTRVVVPGVSITANPLGPVSAGTPVTFTAAETNGGTTPVYEWKKNGTVIPSVTGNTYTTSSLRTGDRIVVSMQSYATCASPSVVSSNVITMQVISTGISGIGGWDGELSLYPNPNTGHFTIAATWGMAHIGKRASIDIINGLGQSVYRTEVAPDRAQWSHEVWLSESLANGNYLMRLSGDGMKAVLPFTLNR